MSKYLQIQEMKNILDIYRISVKYRKWVYRETISSFFYKLVVYRLCSQLYRKYTSPDTVCMLHKCTSHAMCHRVILALTQECIFLCQVIYMRCSNKKSQDELMVQTDLNYGTETKIHNLKARLELMPFLIVCMPQLDF